jgi:hypothetical protein
MINDKHCAQKENDRCCCCCCCVLGWRRSAYRIFFIMDPGLVLADRMQIHWAFSEQNKLRKQRKRNTATSKFIPISESAGEITRRDRTIK